MKQYQIHRVTLRPFSVMSQHHWIEGIYILGNRFFVVLFDKGVTIISTMSELKSLIDSE
ncbi:MAG: hypothetical protein V7771_12785 [Shewanella psychromarinicola]|uniref:hypothetical protein n=1 Tax=Shewanella psychromarinicola TaxID=2487742 RepID=UPI0030023DEF